jgi:hypothetical protein
MAFTEEEIRIVQARRAARAARAAAGLPEEPQPQKSRLSRQRPALGKALLIVLMGGLIGLPASLLWNYGTLSPCQALTQAMHEALLQEAGSEAKRTADTPSQETGGQLALSAVDLRIEALSTGACTKALVQLETSDPHAFVAQFLAQPPP